MAAKPKTVYSRHPHQDEPSRVSNVVKSTSFTTREGKYSYIMEHLYGRPGGTPHYSRFSVNVRVSLASEAYLLYNIGADTFFYRLAKLGERVTLSQAIDKWSGSRSGIIPLCHDINEIAMSVDFVPIVLGFQTGSIVYYNPMKKKTVLQLNCNPVVDASSVMAIKWQLGEKYTFVSAHRSGHVYFWNVEQGANSSSSHTTKEIQDAKVKLFSKGHLVQRWKVSHGAVNAIAFSPDGIFMALACQDGFMRVYNVQKLEFHGRMRSHFGGLLCVCWSPDGKYVATGGEDDLVTVWSFDECCVVTRCEGHSSWVNALSFDAVLCPRPTATPKPNHEATPTAPEKWESGIKSRPRSVIEEIAQVPFPAYRLGSVGQDGCLLLWDLTADALRVRRPLSRTLHRSRATLSECSDASSFIPMSPKGKERSVASESRSSSRGNSLAPNDCRDCPQVVYSDPSDSSSQTEMANVANWKNVDLPAEDVRKHQKSYSTGELVSGTLRPRKGQDEGFNGEGGDEKRPPSMVDKPKSHKNGSNKVQKIVKKVSKKVSLRAQVSRIPSSQGEMHQSDDVAPKMHEVNRIEPLIMAHVSPERLTDVHFTKTSILIACQHGFVQVWLRPGLLPHRKPSPELHDSI